MKRRPPDPLFLERQVYMRRRLGDGAKVLPVVGTVLVLLPILWAGTARTAGSGLYLFGVWAFLIVIVAFVSRGLREQGDPDNTTPEDSDDG